MFLAGGAVAVFIALALLVGAVFVLVRSARKRASRARADGVVVALHARVWVSSIGVPTKRDFVPEVEFVGPHGPVRFTSAFGSRPVGFSVGERVRVLYDPAQPGSAEVDTLLSKFLFPGVMGCIGCVFFTIGAVFALLGLLDLSMQ